MQRVQQTLRLGSALVLLLCYGTSEAFSVTPVQKVIELLNGMLEKGEQEKHEEQKAFAEFDTFCSMTRKEKQRLIQAAADKIRDLEADIAKGEAVADQLGNDIAGLDQDIAAWSKEQAKATAERKREREDYEASFQDYSESIGALDRAIQTLKSSKNGEASFAEVQHVLGSTKSQLLAPANKALLAYVQLHHNEVDGDASPPEASAYEFQSGSIVDMLEKILLRFEQERRTLEKEEMNMKHAYEQMKQHVSDNIVYAKKTRAEKVSEKAKVMSEVAAAKGDLGETEAGKKSDETYLQDLTATCQTKASEYEKRQKLRSEELATIQKAIEIVSSPRIAGAAQAHLPAALQIRDAQVLAQLRSSSAVVTPSAQEAASAFLTQQAKKVDSVLLATIASHASSDPFVKVREMIKDLLARLQAEGDAEADHKHWCDEELATNKQSRDTLSGEVESFSAKADELSTLEVTLAAEAKELGEVIADIDEAVAKAVAERSEEKATNAATMADAKGGQAAVTEAITMLKEFYAKADSSSALLQQQRQTPSGVQAGPK